MESNQENSRPKVKKIKAAKTIEEFLAQKKLLESLREQICTIGFKVIALRKELNTTEAQHLFFCKQKWELQELIEGFKLCETPGERNVQKITSSKKSLFDKLSPEMQELVRSQGISEEQFNGKV